jgi:cysteine desulfurase
MGVSAERARGAVRLSLGEPTTDDEIASAAEALAASWRALVRAAGA